MSAQGIGPAIVKWESQDKQLEEKLDRLGKVNYNYFRKTIHPMGKVRARNEGVQTVAKCIAELLDLFKPYFEQNQAVSISPTTRFAELGYHHFDLIWNVTGKQKNYNHIVSLNLIFTHKNTKLLHEIVHYIFETYLGINIQEEPAMSIGFGRIVENYIIR